MKIVTLTLVTFLFCSAIVNAQQFEQRIIKLEQQLQALLTENQRLADAAENATPVGTIVAFGGPESKIPDGWLHCNGQEYENADYPILAATLAKSWGGSGASFNVPDLRGQFLRGWDEIADNDPDKLTRVSKKNGGNSGNKVGSYQEDATSLPNRKFVGKTSSNGEHSHLSFIYKNPPPAGGMPGIATSVGLAIPEQHYNLPTGDHTHDVNINSGGDAETRPKNASVLYIIKAQ